jgi:hypothetical protein
MMAPIATHTAPRRREPPLCLPSSLDLWGAKVRGCHNFIARKPFETATLIKGYTNVIYFRIIKLERNNIRNLDLFLLCL